MNYRDCQSYMEFQRHTGPVNTQGWLTHDESEILFQIIKEMKSGERFVEIGLYSGAQLALVGLVAPEVEVWGIDDWSNDTEMQIHGRRLEDCCRHNLDTAGHWVAERIHIISEKSQDVGPTWDKPINVLVIDGDHNLEPAYLDMHHFCRWVVPGGWACLDDMNEGSQVRDAYARWIDKEPQGRWEIVHRDRYPNKMWVLRRSA